MDIIFYETKNNFQNDFELLNLSFHIFEIYLNFGDLMSKNYDGKNLVKDKFDKLGLNELLEKYLNCPNDNLSRQIIYIYKNYYQ